MADQKPQQKLRVLDREPRPTKKSRDCELCQEKSFSCSRKQPCMNCSVRNQECVYGPRPRSHNDAAAPVSAGTNLPEAPPAPTPGGVAPEDRPLPSQEISARLQRLETEAYQLPPWKVDALNNETMAVGDDELLERLQKLEQAVFTPAERLRRLEEKMSGRKE